MAVFGLPFLIVSLLAKLPALVALNPPADAPLIKLWLVLSVLAVILVPLLCTPLDEFVVLDLLVQVRLGTSPPRSCPDLSFLSCG